MDMTTPKPSPSVQGVRPTPRELAEQLRQRLDITESDEALLEAAITRDREQGRAADAEEIARLREALEALRRMAAKPMKSWDAGSVVDAIQVDEICDEALAAPLALATAATPADPAVKETKR